MPWNDSTKIMTPPIGLGDISQAVHYSSLDLGTLITEGLINKWAKYKPVKMAGVDFPSERNSDLTWKSAATWWKGYNGQCGLTFTTYSALGSPSSGFFAQLLAGNLAWGYEGPTGGINSYPFRAFDFLQYNGAAPKPVTGIYDNLRLYGGGKLTVQLDETRAANDLGIQLDDLIISNSPVSGWYAGILIWKSNSQYTFAFSTNTLGNGADTVEFTNMGNFAGSVKVVPFIASKRANQGVDPGAGIYLSCDVAPQSVSIASEVVAVQMTIDAQFRFSLPGPVKYNIRIINNSGSTITISNMVIALYDGDPSSGGVRVEYKPTIATFSMSNGDTHDETGTFTNQNYDSTKTYYVVVSSDRPEVNGKQVVEPHRG